MATIVNRDCLKLPDGLRRNFKCCIERWSIYKCLNSHQIPCQSASLGLWLDQWLCLCSSYNQIVHDGKDTANTICFTQTLLCDKTTSRSWSAIWTAGIPIIDRKPRFLGPTLFTDRKALSARRALKTRLPDWNSATRRGRNLINVDFAAPLTSPKVSVQIWLARWKCNQALCHLRLQLHCILGGKKSFFMGKLLRLRTY